jgi:hypothetical protein
MEHSASSGVARVGEVVMSTEEPKGTPITPEMRAEIDKAVEATAGEVRRLLDAPRQKRVDEEALAQAREEYQRARQAYMRLEKQWSLVKEQGGSMPDAFWSAFGRAAATVALAERAVMKAREPK